MSDLVALLVTWLSWWSLLYAAYAGFVFGADALLTAWKRRQEERRRHRAELDQINREAHDSLRRIGAAFVLAQRLIRDESANGRVRR